MKELRCYVLSLLNKICMNFSVSDAVILENPNIPNSNRNYDLPITSSDALRLFSAQISPVSMPVGRLIELVESTSRILRIKIRGEKTTFLIEYHIHQ